MILIDWIERKDEFVNQFNHDNNNIFIFLKDNLDIFDEEIIKIYLDNYVYNYDPRIYHNNFIQKINIDLSKEFEYISKINLLDYSFKDIPEDYTLYSLHNVPLHTNLDHTNILNFGAIINFDFEINGDGSNFYVFDELNLVLEVEVFGKKIHSDLHLWKESLYNFYFLYENKNYRAAYVNLFTAFESLLSNFGANPTYLVEDKLLQVIGKWDLHSKNYKKKFKKHRKNRNTISHGCEIKVNKKITRDLFIFFIDTYYKILHETNY